MLYHKNNQYFSEDKIASFLQRESTELIPKQFDKKEFGRRLKSARERSLLSQEELAELVGINKITISYYETGNRKDMNPSITTVYKLSRILEVSIDWLCGMSYTPDISRMSSEVYREFYICMLIKLMDYADGYKKYTRNSRYFKLPRRGLPYTIRESLNSLQIAYSEERVDSETFEREKNKIWDTANGYSVEEIIDTIFNDKSYSEYCSKLQSEREKLEGDSDKADLPF